MTRKKFEAYERVRNSGITNMFDIEKVIALSFDDLDKTDCLDIIKNYSKYEKEYLN